MSNQGLSQTYAAIYSLPEPGAPACARGASNRPMLMPILGHRYLRYLMGAVICAAINNVVLISGDALGLHYAPLLLIGCLMSSSTGYVWHSRVTYADPMTASGYFSFVAGIAIGLPLSLLLLAAMTDWLGYPMWVAAPVMTVLMLLFNYQVARFSIVGIGRRISLSRREP